MAKNIFIKEDDSILMNISGFGAGSNSVYKSINTNSKQYKVAAKDHLAALMEEEAMMTPEQRLLYELMGGHEECDAEL
ncbi:MAG: hypothetical protein OSJ61_18560 [Lachnospiraceae bacterium]|nr:hypothetical protein [Lachnospiraceae bacterium]